MKLPASYKKWDVFISHATEDKEEVARPLAHMLNEAGVKVWFDEFSLRIGDSLTDSINEGLKGSRYGLVIISPAFISKKWTRNELNALFSHEGMERNILPIWHRVSRGDVERFNVVLTDRFALSTREPIKGLAAAVADKLGLISPAEEPAGFEGVWRGVSGRLLLNQQGNWLVGDYDWFGKPWVGLLKGNVDGSAYRSVYRYSWDWSLNDLHGSGFLMRGRIESRVRSALHLFGGWVYHSDEGILDRVIARYLARAVDTTRSVPFEDGLTFPYEFGDRPSYPSLTDRGVDHPDCFYPWVFSADPQWSIRRPYR